MTTYACNCGSIMFECCVGSVQSLFNSKLNSLCLELAFDWLELQWGSPSFLLMPGVIARKDWAEDAIIYFEITIVMLFREPQSAEDWVNHSLRHSSSFFVAASIASMQPVVQWVFNREPPIAPGWVDDRSEPSREVVAGGQSTHFETHAYMIPIIGFWL